MGWSDNLTVAELRFLEIVPGELRRLNDTLERIAMVLEDLARSSPQSAITSQFSG